MDEISGVRLIFDMQFIMKNSLTASVVDFGTTLSVQAKEFNDSSVSAGSFKTLVAVFTAAGLADALKDIVTFTVFAPTEKAFVKLPKANLDALLRRCSETFFGLS